MSFLEDNEPPYLSTSEEEDNVETVCDNEIKLRSNHQDSEPIYECGERYVGRMSVNKGLLLDLILLKFTKGFVFLHNPLLDTKGEKTPSKGLSPVTFD